MEPTNRPDLTHNAEYDAGLNLDLPYIDYPTGWAIQKTAHLDHVGPCSAKQTNGAMLCDCTALIYKWADLKWKHERSKALRDAQAAEQRYERLVEALTAAYPRYNCELRYDGTEDPVMAAYVDAWREVDQIIQTTVTPPEVGQS